MSRTIDVRRVPYPTHHFWPSADRHPIWNGAPDWEGITNVKVMYSKWADACLQTLAFDSVPHTTISLLDDPFCCYIVRLFSQLSAMAMLKLHLEDWDLLETMLTQPPAANPTLGRDNLLAPNERECLERSPDAVYMVASRINRAITTRQRAGGISAPSPQVRRLAGVDPRGGRI